MLRLRAMSNVLRAGERDGRRRCLSSPFHSSDQGDVEVKTGTKCLRWDLPLRAVAAASLVLIVTGLAAGMGPTLSGMLAPFPIASTALVVFAQRESGPEAAVQVLKGFLTALFAFASFFAVLGLTLETWSIPLAFSAALLVAALVQGVAAAATR